MRQSPNHNIYLKKKKEKIPNQQSSVSHNGENKKIPPKKQEVIKHYEEN